MDKKLLAYICITLISFLGAFVFTVLYYDPYSFISQEGKVFDSDTGDLLRVNNPTEKFFNDEHRPPRGPDAPVKKLIAGICCLALVGYLLRFCYVKYMKDSKAESAVLANALHKIALESGRTEYELFVISAERWSIPRAQIDEDFKNYMGANVLPYYVMDLVRKNKDSINESLKKEGQIDPSSRWDLVKALLIFPGGLLIPYFLLLIFRPYFFRY